MSTFNRCFTPGVVAFLLAPVIASAAYRHGDVVSMTYRTSQLTGRAEESQEKTRWEEALRSQMPRFGRPGTVYLKPSLPADGASHSPAAEEEKEEEQLTVAFAFSHEQFFLRRVKLTLREGGPGGSEGGPRPLSRLVIAFTCSAGDIVRVRSDPVYGGGSGVAGTQGFDVEYRWDRLPEEDEQAGVWLVFAVSLVLTIVLAVDTCNGTAGGDSDWDEGRVGRSPPPPPPPSSSSPSSSLARTGRREHGDGDGARAGRVGSGGGAFRPGGGDERRRRR